MPKDLSDHFLNTCPDGGSAPILAPVEVRFGMLAC
jgi:hypothetical protein